MFSQSCVDDVQNGEIEQYADDPVLDLTKGGINHWLAFINPQERVDRKCVAPIFFAVGWSAPFGQIFGNERIDPCRAEWIGKNTMGELVGKYESPCSLDLFTKIVRPRDMGRSEGEKEPSLVK